MIIVAGIVLSIMYASIKVSYERCIVRVAYAITGLGLFIYVLTEVLSLFGKMNRFTCTATWIIYDCILLALVLSQWRINKMRLTDITHEILAKISAKEYLCVAIFAVYGLFICLLSVRIVPYNWDSLSYHLSRLWFWTQNESVGHFTTSDTRMLGTPAFKEFIDLHLYLLYGKNNDSVFNLTQSVSYLFNILFVYSIARRIGCSFKGGLFASVLFATSPTVFAESLSTQTDEFAALWIFVFVSVLLELVYCDDKLQLNKRGIIRLCVLAFSLALSILTKPSGLFCVAVFFFWLLYICLKRGDNIALIVKWILLVAAIMVITILPEAIRNIVTYGAISDPWQGPGQLVLTFDLRYQIVNFFKSIGYFLPGVLWPSFNQIWQHMVYYLGYVLHIDVDSLIISEGGNYHDSLIYKIENYEYDTATNSVITILFIVISLVAIAKCVWYFICRIRKTGSTSNTCPVRLGYSTAAFAAFIVTCAFVKSEVYVCRYMIAAFGLLAVAISFQIQKLGEYRSKLLEGVVYGAAGLLICSQFIGMTNYHMGHIFVGTDEDRAKAYYETYNMSEYESVYVVLKQYLEDKGETYHSIGLKMDAGAYSYPTLRLLEEYSDSVYFIDVYNSSSKYLDKTNVPDSIVVITFSDMGDMYSEGYSYNGYNYMRDGQLSGRCNVFIK
ncbi:hypothetical protein [Butyrivibrio fibrisolvens]|uniref:hypothetical protein n=1 Tax=Butyrivibrio fibrisolvens TaxID=831 RepID=UPI00040E59D6|nr:hypothetical protein [Butyrivibrio fibrisolvens]